MTRGVAGTAICLCSGGLDSTVVLASLLGRDWNCVGLFVAYGQVAVQREEEAFRAVCTHYGVEPVVRTIALWTDQQSALLGNGGTAYLRHRNLALLLTADLLAEERQASGVAGGFCVAPDYPDSTRAFLAVAGSCLDLSGGSSRLLLAPLIDLDKCGIGRLAAELGVPVDVTVSCYGSGSAACGSCRGCGDRQAALEAYRGTHPGKGTRAIQEPDLRLDAPWPRQ